MHTLRAHARITSHFSRRRRGAGTPACRVDTRVDPLTRKPQNAAADMSVRATSGAAKLILARVLRVRSQRQSVYRHRTFNQAPPVAVLTTSVVSRKWLSNWHPCPSVSIRGQFPNSIHEISSPDVERIA